MRNKLMSEGDRPDVKVEWTGGLLMLRVKGSSSAWIMGRTIQDPDAETY